MFVLFLFTVLLSFMVFLNGLPMRFILPASARVCCSRPVCLIVFGARLQTSFPPDAAHFHRAEYPNVCV